MSTQLTIVYFQIDSVLLRINKARFFKKLGIFLYLLYNIQK